MTLVRILTIIFLLLLPVECFSATYSWYFSDDATGNAAGNDTTGDGSIGNPWKSLNKAQSQILTLTSSDTATLYFDRSDTWDASTPNLCDGELCSDWTSGTDYVLGLHNGTVHIDAYGSGDVPVFDGGVTSWASDPRTATRRTEAAINIQTNNSTVKNIELKRVTGSGILLRDPNTGSSDLTGVEVSGCKVHDLGYAGIFNWSGVDRDYYSITIKNNEVYDAVQLMRYGYISTWPGGIQIDGASSTGTYYSNTITGNKVYNIYGEGIILSCGHGPLGTEESILEENFIGDTWKAGILLHYNCYEAGKVACRYNWLVSSTTGRAIYGSTPEGITVYDEQGDGYDNATYGDFEIYGNIAIGRYTGLRLYCDNKAYNDPLGNLKVFNNTWIDNWNANVRIEETAGADDVNNFEYYNNASIYFNQSGQAHVNESGTLNYSNSTISDNYYWDEVAGNQGTVDGDWDTDLCGDGSCEDPLLPGEPSVNWDGLAAITDVTFADIFPGYGSGLIDGGKTLTEEATFLAYGTDYSTLPGTETFVTAEQGDCGVGWEFGSVVFNIPVVSITANDAAADEDGGTGQYTISCSPNCAGETINISYSGGATINTDYDLANGEDVEDGDIAITGASDTIDLTPVDDSDIESSENATITVDAGTGYVAGSPSYASVVIADNDDPSPPTGGATLTLSGGDKTITIGGGSLTLTISPEP